MCKSIYDSGMDKINILLKGFSEKYSYYDCYITLCILYNSEIHTIAYISIYGNNKYTECNIYLLMITTLCLCQYL